jgi:hypothetical protein
MDGTFITHAVDEKCVRIVGKPEEKRRVGRRRRRWEDNIKVGMRSKVLECKLD